MLDQICQQNALTQVLDPTRIEETKLRITWEDTMIDIDYGCNIGDLTEKYGIEQGDSIIIYRQTYS